MTDSYEHLQFDIVKLLPKTEDIAKFGSIINNNSNLHMTKETEANKIKLEQFYKDCSDYHVDGTSLLSALVVNKYLQIAKKNVVLDNNLHTNNVDEGSGDDNAD